MAFLYVEHFVVHPGNVITQRRLTECNAFAQLIFRQPAVGRKCKVKFVAIVSCLFGSYYRIHSGKLEAAQTFEIVDHLAMFIVQLRRVVDVLPRAASASAKVYTEWCRSRR